MKPPGKINRGPADQRAHRFVADLFSFRTA